MSASAVRRASSGRSVVIDVVASSQVAGLVPELDDWRVSRSQPRIGQRGRAECEQAS